jgi:uncharacterized protein (DUF58 family)
VIAPARWRTLLTGWRRRLAARPTPATADSLTIIDSVLLHNLDRLSLQIGPDLIYGLMGEHRAVRRTSGIEFADYRPYSPGDDLRQIDWNAYARLGTLQVRRAQAEHDTLVYLLVDASPSMDFGRANKFWAARRLAAALGYLALIHLDSAVLAAPGAPAALAAPTAPLRSRTEAGVLFRHLQELQIDHAAPFDAVLKGWSLTPGQGRLAIILSDLLLDGYQEGVRQLVAAGFAVTVLHILSPEELQAPETGDLDLYDRELGEQMELHLGAEGVLAYERRLRDWLQATETWCKEQRAGYFLIQSDWDVERVLLQPLRRGGLTV